MAAYFRFVLRHRFAVIVVCLGVTALSVYGFSTAVIATSIRKMFFGDSPRYAAYQERTRRFGNDELFIVAYEDAAPLSRPSLRRLRRVTAGVRTLPGVARARSLLDAQRIFSEGDALRVEAYADEAEAHPGRAPALLARLVQDPLASGLLIARDGRHAAVIIELTVDPKRPAEAIPELVDRTVALFRAEGYPAQRLHLAGIPPLLSEIVSQTYLNLKRLFPISMVLLLAVVLALFRRLTPAGLALLVSGIAVTWTVGFARLLDREFSIMMSIVPGVVLIVAFSDVIHLYSAFRLELAAGKAKQEAILASAADVGTACLLTSATTFVGFICLSLIPTPMFRFLGVVLGFGVAVALILAMTLVPVVLSLLRAPATPGVARGDRLDGLLRWAARLTATRPWWVVAVFGLALVAATVGLARLHIEADLSQRFDPRTRFRQDQDYFARHFAGTNCLELFIDAPRPGGVLDGRTFRRIAAAQDRIAQQPEVDKVVSLVTLLRELHQALGGRGALPQSREGLAQLLLLFEMAGGEDLEQQVDFQRRSMRLVAHIHEYGLRATHEAGQAASASATGLLRGRAKVETSGLAFLLGWWLDAVVAGQRNGVLLSCAVIALMMVLGLRSLRVGLLSMIPNVLPLLALGGYLGATVDRVDSDTLVIAMIAIGIGVDDTIHFLMRYRIESARSEGRFEAIRRTFTFSGRAIVLTTVVLVAGFAPFASSNYYSAHILGTLLPGVLVVALLADLLLVPAMVQLGALAFPQRERPR